MDHHFELIALRLQIKLWTNEMLNIVALIGPEKDLCLFTKKLNQYTNDAETHQFCVSEVDKLKGMILQQNHGNDTHQRVANPSEDLSLAKEAASQAQESLKV